MSNQLAIALPPKRSHSSTRRYSERTLKVLWGRSAGRCAMPECRCELFVDDSDYDPIVIIGDIAHVEAASNAGPRGNPNNGIRNRDEYDNLILLCKNCHARIDGQKRKFSLEALRQIKFDHETWVRHQLPERGLSRTAWTVILLQGAHPIDEQLAVTALRPDYPENSPYLIETCPEKEAWQNLSDYISTSVQTLFERSDPFNRRFAIFPLAPVSACINLGFCLTDRPRIKLFQYHRHAQSWDWEVARHNEPKSKLVGLPDKTIKKRGEVVVCFEISAKIHKAHRDSIGRNVIGQVGLQVPRPSTAWLRSSNQIDHIGTKAHQLFEDIQHRFPNATCWHLLVATPAPVAVRIGQAMNPTMIPPVKLYEFNRSAVPAYAHSLSLGGRA